MPLPRWASPHACKRSAVTRRLRASRYASSRRARRRRLGRPRLLTTRPNCCFCWPRGRRCCRRPSCTARPLARAPPSSLCAQARPAARSFSRMAGVPRRRLPAAAAGSSPRPRGAPADGWACASPPQRGHRVLERLLLCPARAGGARRAPAHASAAGLTPARLRARSRADRPRGGGASPHASFVGYCLPSSGEEQRPSTRSSHSWRPRATPRSARSAAPS